MRLLPWYQRTMEEIEFVAWMGAGELEKNETLYTCRVGHRKLEGSHLPLGLDAGAQSALTLHRHTHRRRVLLQQINEVIKLKLRSFGR